MASRRASAENGLEGISLSRGRAEPARGIGLSEIILATDYGAALPLWGDDGNLKGAIAISGAIETELLEWSDRFQENYDEELGWPSREMCLEQYRRGERLRVLLQDSLGEATKVRFDFWELLVRGEEIALEELFEEE